MADDDEKWENSKSCRHEVGEEEEEEALSLCDLPVNWINDGGRSSKEEAPGTESNQDFDFSPWDVCQSTESEMCAADDIFFQGQILPLRLSLSSECNFNKFSKLDSFKPSRSISRSESMDHYSLVWSTSFSSRSSSSRSHKSSSSNGSSVAIKARVPKPRVSNQFLCHHQSPRPQIRLPISQLGGNPASYSTRKSSVWNILRRGLVRTPEMELQDLKVRNSAISRNSSSSSSSSNSNGHNNFSQIDVNDSSVKPCNSSQEKNLKKQRLISDKRRGLLSGCSCSVSVIKPAALNALIIRNSNSSTGNHVHNHVREPTDEKQKHLKIKIKNEKKMEGKQEGKQAMARHRTYEWIKEL
ncbi:hypothetical protein K2173_002482 [Erythroxylum novogranatense]|uniref:Uncharacterized protein n=1 Tax=Erythroxylum novogranatense TaxID=1862640 RepID=A0AAV8TU24_9ROSI|nr:hypothetical protein K2173_002482 [Erythroxylum novogranatense]